jgi:hypothetical protein
LTLRNGRGCAYARRSIAWLCTAKPPQGGSSAARCRFQPDSSGFDWQSNVDLSAGGGKSRHWYPSSFVTLRSSAAQCNHHLIKKGEAALRPYRNVVSLSEAGVTPSGVS